MGTIYRSRKERDTLSRVCLFLASLWPAAQCRFTAKLQKNVCACVCGCVCVWSSPLAAHYKFETGVATELCQRPFNYCLALCVCVCVHIVCTHFTYQSILTISGTFLKYVSIWMMRYLTSTEFWKMLCSIYVMFFNIKNTTYCSGFFVWFCMVAGIGSQDPPLSFTLIGISGRGWMDVGFVRGGCSAEHHTYSSTCSAFCSLEAQMA